VGRHGGCFPSSENVETLTGALISWINGFGRKQTFRMLSSQTALPKMTARTIEKHYVFIKNIIYNSIYQSNFGFSWKTNIVESLYN
jgi:hypothetical protein